MDSFNQLLQYCIEHKHWVTLNYSPYDQTYQVFVNPGRTMSAAKRHKTLADAVRSCWLALGGKPQPPKTLMQVFAEEKPQTWHVELDQPKRRGRPKGSKNKPKVVAE